jgi:hypothetical protein
MASLFKLISVKGEEKVYLISLFNESGHLFYSKQIAMEI